MILRKTLDSVAAACAIRYIAARMNARIERRRKLPTFRTLAKREVSGCSTGMFPSTSEVSPAVAVLVRIFGAAAWDVGRVRAVSGRGDMLEGSRGDFGGAGPREFDDDASSNERNEPSSITEKLTTILCDDREGEDEVAVKADSLLDETEE